LPKKLQTQLEQPISVETVETTVVTAVV